MKLNRVSFVRRLLRSERGQTVAMVAIGMIAFIGIAGLATDLGHAYYAREILQLSSNSAALAAVAALPNTNTATTAATKYSALPGDYGANSSLTNVSMTGTPTYLKLTTLTNIGIQCETSTGSTSGCFNAAMVKQTAKVPLWFGGMFGIPAFNITASATASVSGGPYKPWNIAIILDTTASMASGDSGLQCSGTQISCALQGVQDLLQLMYPCTAGTTCTAQSGNPLMVNNPIDDVSLFVFPAVTTATETKDYVCPTSNPTIGPYQFPVVTPGGTQNLILPTTENYQVVPFSGNYRTSDAATTLDTSSEIAIAAGAKSGCDGLEAPGGEATYYAQVIYAAQKALVAQQTLLNNNSQNAIILLTDGNATACAASANTGAGGCSSTTEGIQVSSGGGVLNGTTQTGYTAASKISYTYPSALGECGQAIVAAQAAATAGTRVYTIGYGSPTGSNSSDCPTDVTYSAYPGISPCTAMLDMASSPQYSYSDDGDGCVSADNSAFTNLKQIFQKIAGGFTTPKLIPNGTT